MRFLTTKCLMNLLIPMSDQDIISLYQINTTSNRQVMRIKKNISVWIISWFNTKFSEQTSKELYGRQSRELLRDNERVNTIVSLSPLSSGLYSSLFYTRYAGKTSLTKMMVLFLIIGMVTKETHQVRVHSRPFPVYPGWQVQTYDPLVFVQVAFTFFFQALFSLLPK